MPSTLRQSLNCAAYEVPSGAVCSRLKFRPDRTIFSWGSVARGAGLLSFFRPSRVPTVAPTLCMSTLHSVERDFSCP